MRLLEVFSGFLEDSSEILVNGFDEVYREKAGVLEKVKSPFETLRAYESYVENLVHEFDLDLSIEKPFSEKEIYENFRLVLVHSVIAGKPKLSLRKLTPQKIPQSYLDQYEQNNTLQVALKNFINRKTTLIVGGTGSGKTTLMNYFLNHVPEHERIVALEDLSELKIMHPHVVYLKSRLPLNDSIAEVSLNDLVRLSLRLRPDRLVLGEVRSHEVVPFIQAVNTGHEGSVVTFHGASCEGALRRLALLFSSHQTGIKVEEALEVLCFSIAQVVVLERGGSGERRVKEIRQVHGFEFGRPLLEPLIEE